MAGVETNNHDLLRRALDGDPKAEHDLFEHLSARLHALAKRKIWDEEEAREIAQDALMTIWSRYKEAPMPGGFIKWCQTVLRNKIGNYLQARERHERLEPQLREQMISEAHVGTPQNGIEIRRRVERAISLLDAECRRIIHLLLRGYTSSQIAREIGDRSIGTTYSRISRCRKRLLELYEQ